MNEIILMKFLKLLKSVLFVLYVFIFNDVTSGVVLQVSEIFSMNTFITIATKINPSKSFQTNTGKQ